MFSPGSFTLFDTATGNYGTLTFAFTTAPEPSTWAMMALGLVGPSFLGYRRGGTVSLTGCFVAVCRRPRDAHRRFSKASQRAPMSAPLGD